MDTQNKKKLTYDVIDSSFVSSLIEQVNEALNRGWEPQGGICSLRVSDENWYLQALVKKVDKEK